MILRDDSWLLDSIYDLLFYSNLFFSSPCSFSISVPRYLSLWAGKPIPVLDWPPYCFLLQYFMWSYTDNQRNYENEAGPSNTKGKGKMYRFRVTALVIRLSFSMLFTLEVIEVFMFVYQWEKLRLFYICTDGCLGWCYSCYYTDGLFGVNFYFWCYIVYVFCNIVPSGGSPIEVKTRRFGPLGPNL